MKYRVEGVDNLIKEIENKEEKALVYCAEYLQNQLKEEIQKDSYDTGALASSINRRKRKNYIEVGTNLVYAVVREYGRNPGKYPPFDSLVGWSARKGMIHGATSSYSALSSKDKSVVYLIARKIKIKGIKGKHTFEKVRKREKSNIINLFNKKISEG